MNPKLIEIAQDIESASYEVGGTIYHPIPFPEFAHIKTSSKPKSAENKWDMIYEAFSPSVSFDQLKVLDVGSNIGFYTFNFAKRGSVVNAFEPHEHYATIGKRITEATALKSTWHNKVLEENDIAQNHYDVALMLSVFQWMSEGDKYLKEATEMFQLIAKVSDTIFFELGCNHGKSAISSPKRSISWIWEFLHANTTGMEVYHLGRAAAWGRNYRHMFVCTRKPEMISLNIRQRAVTTMLKLIG